MPDLLNYGRGKLSLRTKFQSNLDKLFHLKKGIQPTKNKQKHKTHTQKKQQQQKPQTNIF
jgi:hypothetical protein